MSGTPMIVFIVSGVLGVLGRRGLDMNEGVSRRFLAADGNRQSPSVSALPQPVYNDPYDTAEPLTDGYGQVEPGVDDSEFAGLDDVEQNYIQPGQTTEVGLPTNETNTIPNPDSMGSMTAPYRGYDSSVHALDAVLANVTQKRMEEQRRCSTLRQRFLQDVDEVQQDIQKFRSQGNTPDDLVGFKADMQVAILGVEKHQDRMQQLIAKCASDERRYRSQIVNVDKHRRIMQRLLEKAQCDGPDGDEIPHCAYLRDHLLNLENSVDAKAENLEKRIVAEQNRCEEERSSIQAEIDIVESELYTQRRELASFEKEKRILRNKMELKTQAIQKQKGSFEVSMRHCRVNLKNYDQEVMMLRMFKSDLGQLGMIPSVPQTRTNTTATTQMQPVHEYEAAIQPTESSDAPPFGSLEQPGMDDIGTPVAGNVEAQSPVDSEVIDGQASSGVADGSEPDFGDFRIPDDLQQYMPRNEEKSPGFDNNHDIAGDLREQYPDFE